MERAHINHGICVEVKGQLAGAASLLSPRGSWRFNSGRKVWKHVPAEPSYGPSVGNFHWPVQQSGQVSLSLLRKWRRYGGVQIVKYNTYMLSSTTTSKLWVEGREIQTAVAGRGVLEPPTSSWQGAALQPRACTKGLPCNTSCSSAVHPQ